MPLLSWNRGYQKKGVPLGLPTSHAAFPWIKGTYIYAPVCLVHHGCVGVFREIGNGFVNCTSCLTLWVHWRIFFFLVTRPAFCGRLVQRNFAGAPQWDNPFLLHASGVWGEVRWGEWDVWGEGESVLWRFSKICYFLKFLRAMKVNCIFIQTNLRIMFKKSVSKELC